MNYFTLLFFGDLGNKVYPLEAQILQKTILAGIHSASAIEVVEGRIFVAGDDTAWLYVLDKTWAVTHKIRLFESPFSERIPKLQKPDLEAITTIPWEGEQVLLVVGSGSTTNRQEAFVVHPRTFNVQPYSLAPLYEHLQTLPSVVGTRKLNIEGLAATAEALIFFQRGNVSGTNVLISYPLRDFTHWLKGNSPLPTPRVTQYALPAMEGTPAGFSGATAIPSQSGQLLFTASVEATDDEINDGATLGSFVGIIDVSSSTATPKHCAPLLWNGQPYLGKVESITVWEEEKDNLTAVAVTDSDGGDSELLLLRISW